MPRRSVSHSPSNTPPRRARDTALVERASPPRSPPRYQAEPEPEKEPKLFIGSLAAQASQDDLRTVFSPHGEIVDLYLCRKETGTFAFVTFSSLEEAEKALQCAGTQIQGQQIKVNFAKPRAKREGGGGERRRRSPPRHQPETEKQPKLFIGNLSAQVSEDDLRNLFSPHGEIVDLFVMRKETGTFAFVTYSSVEEAEKALTCSGTEVQGQQIRVNFAKPKKNAGGGNKRACFKCQQEGHMARDCPNQQTQQQNNRDQTEKPERRKGVCFKCQQEGHMARDCPNEQTQHQNNRDQGERTQRKRGVCFKCQKEGHMARDCPGVDEEKMVNQEEVHHERKEERPRGCFKCHQEGHMARDCPGTENKMVNEVEQHHTERRQDRPKGCFKCHQEGHMARDCPENPEQNNNRGRERRDNYHVGARNRRNEGNFDNRKIDFNRYNPFTGQQYNFPSGREDYVNNGQNTSSETTNNFNREEGEKFFMRRNTNDQPFKRKRSPSKEPESPKKPMRKRSVQDEGSPKRESRPQLNQEVEQMAVKQGFQSQKPGQRSRSRSRSNQKAPIKAAPTPAPRKRSPSADSY